MKRRLLALLVVTEVRRILLERAAAEWKGARSTALASFKPRA